MDEMLSQTIVMLRSLMLEQENFVERATAELNEDRDGYATEEDFFNAVARLSVEMSAQWMFSEMLMYATEEEKKEMRYEINRTR